MSKILVTGGAGFIGTHLSRKLIGAGHKVCVIDLKQPADRVEGAEYFQGDVRDRALVDGVLKDTDAVYHFAATVSVPICQRDPIESYSNNFSATLGLLEQIRASKRKIRFAFASTAALYGAMGDDGRALKEEDVAEEFMSFYAGQKHASEQAIRLFRGAYGIPASIFRFFNVFGPGQDPTSPYSGVITVFSRFAREGKPMPLNGGGAQTRDFVSVHDLVDGCASVLALPDDKWDASPTNLGTGSTTTVRELAEIIRKVAQSQSEITLAPAREGDVLHSKADIRRAREKLGFSPKVSLQTGLVDLLGAQR